MQITWKLQVGGDAAGTSLSTDLAPTLTFMLTPVELLPASAPGGPGPSTAGASVSKTGSAHIAAVGARTFTFWRLRVTDGLARRLAIVLVALGARRDGHDPRARSASIGAGAAGTLLGRYRYLLVNADSIPLAGRRPEVQVDSMRDLVRLAKLHEELIVHAEESGRHHFALFTDAVVYRYDIPPAVRVRLRERRLGQVGTRRTRSVRSRAAAHVTRVVGSSRACGCGAKVRRGARRRRSRDRYGMTVFDFFDAVPVPRAFVAVTLQV